MGNNKRLGHFLKLRDVYGNTYTYAHLKKLVGRLPGAEGSKTVTRAAVAKELKLPKADPKPTAPASAGTQLAPRAKAAAQAAAPKAAPKVAPAAAPTMSPRSACSPTRAARPPSSPAARSRSSTPAARSPATRPSRATSREVFGLKRTDVRLKR